MSTPNGPIVGPHPGTYLTERQGQRAECLRLVLALVVGRSVPIGIVIDMARWIYDGANP